MANISIVNASLSYSLKSTQTTSLRLSFMKQLAGGFIDRKSNKTFVQALSNVSLNVKDREIIGLSGHNGAGKTTLLRMMAGILRPTEGTVTTNAKVQTLFSLGQGMHPELTGRENINRIAVFSGFDEMIANEQAEEIIEFTELGEFIDQPVKYYSLGMIARLAFAVVTLGKPEILLIDEILGVGDASFQIKARARLQRMMEHANICFIANHSHDILEETCTRILTLQKGSIVGDRSINKCI